MRETKQLEFKQEVNNTFLKTVSAYANFEGGKILFGIQDDGTIIGIEDPYKISLNIENKINDSIQPKPNFTLSVSDKNVITLEISEGLHKPYFYKGKAFRRSDTSTVEVDQIELKRLILQGENIYFEELETTQQSLEFKELSKQLKTHLNVNQFSKDIAKTLGFYTLNGKLNNAAELFADQNTFPGIDIIRFGASISDILDREFFENESILLLYEKAMTVFDRYYRPEKIVGSTRQHIELIPKEAFRETLANALVHRTWDVKSHIRISMYPDYIEINSPGGLPLGVTEEEYRNGFVSQLRNPVIANVLFRLDYIEMFGTGIKRIKESYINSSVKPQFIITDNNISITLPVIDQVAHLTTDEKVIYDILSSGILMASSELANISGFNKTKVVRLLNSLIDKKYVSIIGRGRGTKYKI